MKAQLNKFNCFNKIETISKKNKGVLCFGLKTFILSPFHFGIKLKLLLVVICALNLNEGKGQCPAAWSSGTAYTGGSVVLHDGFRYTAQYWTQDRTPSQYCTTCGTPGTYTDWVKGSACSACTSASISSHPSTSSASTCLNGTAFSALSVTAAGSATLSYQWQSSTQSNFSSGVSNVGTNSASYTPVNTSAGTLYYRCVVTSSCNSSTATSNASGAFTVTAAPSAGTLSGTQGICLGGSSTFSSTVVGGSWSSGSTGIATINASTGVISGVAAGTATMTYTVTGTGGCSNATATRTVTVSAASVGGTIAGSATVCTGTNSTVLTLSGHTGNVTRWESSPSSTFASAVTSIANTTTTLTATNLTATTYYRAVITSGSCAAANSATGTVTVNQQSDAPTSISGTTDICNGSSTTLTANGGIAGYDADYVWYSSACPTDIYTQEWATQPFTLTNTTQNSLSNGVLNVTSTTDDPMITMSGLGSFDPSTYRYINIRYRVTAGTANDLEIFFFNTAHNNAVAGESVSEILVSDNTWRTVSLDMWTDPQYKTGGNITGWRFDCARAPFVTMDIDFISLSTQAFIGSGSTFSVSPTSTTNYYVSYKGGCNTTSCASTSVNVSPTSVGGTVAGSATVCTGTNTTTLTLSGHTGTITRWESSLDNFATAGTSIANTTTTLTATNLIATTTYRAVVTSGSCAAANSATAIVTVSPAVNYGTVASGNQTICNGATPSSMSVSGAVGSGSFTYQWYSQSGIVTAPTGSSTAGWTSLGTTGGANTATYTPASGISSSTTYACLVTPGGSPTCGTATWATSARQVTVSAPLSVSPGGVSDQLLVWLKADAGTSSLGTSWQDQGCNANHYATVSGPTVISNDINFNPAIEILSGGFNGPAGAAIGTSWTLFSVHRLLPSDANGRLIDGATGNNLLGNHGVYSNGIYLNGNPAEYEAGIATTTNTQTQTLYCYSRDNATGNIIVRVNGDLLKTFTSTNTASGIIWDLNQGAYAGESSDARMGEFIVFNKALSATEILKVEAYLATKYAIVLSNADGGTGGDFVSTGGTTYWDASASTAYSNEIVVLGKDANTGLTQKQSKSSDDSLRVYVGSFAAANTSNAGTITNDQSFLVLGHNNGKLKANYLSSLEKPSGITSRFQREWKVVNTNFTDNFTLRVQYDSSTAITLSHLRLLVDDDGNFSNATAYGTADGLTFSHGSIIISGISTSMIPSGSTKYITIGSTSTSTTLPVNLLSFDAVLQDGFVELSWETASEINNDHFVVERSNDGVNWTSFAKVKGAGNSNSTLSYFQADVANFTGVRYYRLTQVDFDGTKETFKAIDVSKIATAPFEIKVFPNPMNEEVKVSFFADKQGYSRFRIYAESGQEMYGGLVGTVQGENSFNFNTSSFTEGIYVFKIEKENGVVSTVKVVK